MGQFDIFQEHEYKMALTLICKNAVLNQYRFKVSAFQTNPREKLKAMTRDSNGPMKLQHILFFQCIGLIC